MPEKIAPPRLAEQLMNWQLVTARSKGAGWSSMPLQIAPPFPIPEGEPPEMDSA
jgi:hypothetical protein